MKDFLRLSFAVLFVSFLGLSLTAQGNPASVSLGSVSVGATSSATVTLTLPATATVGSIQVLTQGTPDLDYTNSGGGTCTPGNSYAANESCTVEVEFAPRYPGVRSGAVALLDNSGNVLATVYLAGFGSGPQTIFSSGYEKLIANNLSLPYILIDPIGNIYISPKNGSQITKETLSGSGYMQSTLSLNGRVGALAIDGAGNFFVAAAGVVYKETRSSSGYVESMIGTGASQPYVTGVAVDGSGNVYLSTLLSDSGTQILKETPKPGGYTLSTVFDGPVGCYPSDESGLSSCYSSLAVDGSGNVFAAFNAQVLEFSPESSSGADGYSSKSIVSGLSYAADVTVDALGNLFIADTGNSRVIKASPKNGSYIQSIVPSQPILYPTQAIVDPAGNVYIAAINPKAGIYNSYEQLLKETYSSTPGLTFAATSPGIASSDSPRTVVVTNDGTTPLNFSGVTYPGDFPESSQVPGACLASTSLAAGANCVLTINFNPRSLPGSDANPFVVSGDVAIVTNTLNIAATKQEILMNGQEARAANSIYINSTPNPSQAGIPVKFTAVVAATATGPVPTGSVTFVSGSTVLATVSLTGGVAIFSTSTLPKGTTTVSATYSGDSVYTSATSNSIAQVVGLSIPTVVLSSATNSSYVGTPIQFTAMVAGVPNDPSPTGTVTFSSGGMNLGSTSIVSGAAVLPISFPASGTQTVSASYSGDANYAPAASLNAVNITLTLAQFFGSAPTLTAGSTAPVTVTIPSVGKITGISILTLGIPNQDFTNAAGGTCKIGTVYAQGATCTVNVAFKPTHAGTHSGAIAIMDSTSSTAPISTVYLQGSLDGPQLAFSSNPFNDLGPVRIYPTTPLTIRAPGGVAVDPSGDLFVAAVGTGVTKWTLANGVYTQTNLTPNGGPGIAIDGIGNLFVTCGAVLCRLSPQSDGSYISSTAATGFKSLYGVAIDPGGNVFLTDQGANAVYKETLQADGTYLQSDIGTGWRSPNGLTLDEKGDIAVANSNSSVVEETLSGSGYSQSIVSSSIGSPVSVTFDASGSVFVAGNTYWLDQGDGCSTAALPPAGGQGLWQEIPKSGNTWLQTMIYTGTSEEVILNDNATGNLYFVDTGLTPNTCYGIFGELYSRPASPAAPLSFGSALFGTASSPQASTVYNQGDQPLIFSTIHFPADFPESPGIPTECKAGTPLAPAATCTLTTVFKPATSLRGGALSLALNESITLTTNSVAGSQQSISLSGTEIAPTTATPVLSLPGGTYMSAQIVTITDATPGAVIYYTTDGNRPTISSNKYKGAITVSSTEVVEAIAIAPGYNQSAVPFASYIITPATPTLSVSPASLTFASLSEGSTSSAQTVTLKNNGTAPATLGAMSFTGANIYSFVVSAKTCSTTLAAGASCTLSLEFQPAKIGNLAASLSIADNAKGSPQTVSLKGTATVPLSVTVSPTSLAFTSLAEGSASAPQSVTVKNTGTTTVTLGVTSFTGSNIKSFFVSATTCGTSLPAGKVCTISVEFKPAVKGSLSAALNIDDDATGSPQLVTLTGTATAAAP